MIHWKLLNDNYYYGGWCIYSVNAHWKIRTPKRKVLPVSFKDLNRAKEYAALRMERGEQ